MDGVRIMDKKERFGGTHILLNDGSLEGGVEAEYSLIHLTASTSLQACKSVVATLVSLSASTLIQVKLYNISKWRIYTDNTRGGKNIGLLCTPNTRMPLFNRDYYFTSFNMAA